MKVLINVPKLNLPGGVTALFNVLKMNQHYENVDYFELSNNLPKFISLPLKYIEFTFKIIKYDVIHLNPSLNAKSFLRDALFAIITKLFNKKLIIYWHGWDADFEQRIKNNSFLKFMFNNSYNKAERSIVLGTIFKNKLIGLGCMNKIIIETNAAENKFIDKEINRDISKKVNINLLFLSRIEEKKGIYIAIESLRILNGEENKFKLYIAGNGSLESEIKTVAENSDDIIWVGYVDNVKKHELLLESDIMILPSYSEGMPLTLLEAIMYGLPIISRPVGGIADVVVDNINGLLISSLDAKDFAFAISKIAQPEVYSKISKDNIRKSEMYTPEKLSERLISIYQSL